MWSRTIWVLSFVTALGAGTIGGVFFAFSSFVLPALSRLPPALGLAAMQSINVVVLNRSFLGVFLATSLGAGLLTLDALLHGSVPGARLRLVGGATYLLGSLLVTMACNVPRNDALAKLTPGTRHATRGWAAFVRAWGSWNALRGLASVLAAALLVLSLTGCSITELAPCSGPAR